MALTTFIISSITKTTNSETPGYIVKLQNKETKTKAIAGLGSKESKTQETYYIKLATVTGKVGKGVDLDPDDYTIIERDFTIPVGEPNAGEVVKLKWLQI